MKIQKVENPLCTSGYLAVSRLLDYGAFLFFYFIDIKQTSFF